MLDEISGGSFPATALAPLQQHTQRCLALLEPAGAAASGPQAAAGTGGDLEAMLAMTRLLQTIERALELLQG